MALFVHRLFLCSPAHPAARLSCALPTGPAGTTASPAAGTGLDTERDNGYRVRPKVAPCVPSQWVPLLCGDSSSSWCPCRDWGHLSRCPCRCAGECTLCIHPPGCTLCCRQLLQCHMQVPALRKGACRATRNTPPAPLPPVGQAGTSLAGN